MSFFSSYLTYIIDLWMYHNLEAQFFKNWEYHNQSTQSIQGRNKRRVQ